MPYQTKATRSHRFILSTSGIAIITLVLLISSPWANANIAGAKYLKMMTTPQISQTNKHKIFETGDVDFNHAVNSTMHHPLAAVLSEEQARKG